MTESHPDKPRKTMRLSWLSELRGVYLFTNRQRETALTPAATSLAQQLRSPGLELKAD